MALVDREIACHASNMAEEQPRTRRANDLGPTGRAVATNLARIRNSLGLSTNQLSHLLGDVGRPIAASAISKIEGGTRRVDSDDLVALAIALDVPPAALLLPPVADREIDILDGYTDDAGRMWDWAEGKTPLRQPATDDGEYWNAWQTRAKPPGRRQFGMGLVAGVTAHANAQTPAGRVVISEDQPEG